MIMDDPCTFVSHSLHRFVPFFMKVSIYNETFRYPDIAELAYGSDRRGCFEIPHDEDEPTCGIDCPDGGCTYVPRVLCSEGPMFRVFLKKLGT